MEVSGPLDPDPVSLSPSIMKTGPEGPSLRAPTQEPKSLQQSPVQANRSQTRPPVLQSSVSHSQLSKDQLQFGLNDLDDP